MVTIPNLPLAQNPLSGGELVPIWQNGQLVQCNQAAFAIPSNIQAAIVTVEANLPAINLVATNINAILAVNFTAASTSFNPAGLTYLTGTNLQSVGQETDAAIAAIYAAIPGDLANYALKSGDLTQFAATTAANLRGNITGTTGTGNLVFGTSPTLTSANLGTATVTSINKVAITQPATGSTLTIQDGFTLTVTSNANLSGNNTGDQSDATLTFSDITTNNASTSQHGFMPKLTGNTALVFNGAGQQVAIPQSAVDFSSIAMCGAV